MKPERQRIAIAEACGWRFEKFMTNPTRLVDPALQLKDTPDYLNCLNAMHEAEKVLTVEQLNDYQEHLKKCQVMQATETIQWRIWHATASQRAEAFLKILGLWKDE